MPRAPFSKLPVQPSIEGWLIAVLSSQNQQRFWAVLALQRMYLFSDNNEVEPSDAIDLKDLTVRCVTEDGASKDRFSADLKGGQRKGHLCQCFPGRASPNYVELQDADVRAFEVSGKSGILQKVQDPAGKSSTPRTRL